MSFQDARGEQLSTALAESAIAYDRTLDLFNSFRLDPLAVLAPALAKDPDFISGHLLMTGLLLSTGDPQMFAPARASLALAAASRHTPTDRERSLHAALRLWADGDPDAGHRRFDRHLADHPRDLLALQLAHLGDLMLGRTTMLRDRLARVEAHWSEHDIGYGYLLGMRAFGLEECFAYEEAEATGRRAVSMQPHDAWAIHAVAHVCEMQGRSADGIRWMAETHGGWAHDNGMAVHNHWHLALMHLAQGEHAAVLARYDESVAPSPQSMALDLIDASALLWRLYLRGIDVGDRWTVLAQRWREQGLPGCMAFNDVHAAISFAAAGDDTGASMLAAAVRDAATRPDAPAAWRDVAVPTCQAIAAMLAGDPSRCVELLLPVLPVASSLGGSHAQRDLLLLTVCEAATRSGDTALASALSAQRQVHRVPRRSLPIPAPSGVSRRLIAVA